jgi:hypothetical protein
MTCCPSSLPALFFVGWPRLPDSVEDGLVEGVGKNGEEGDGGESVLANDHNGAEKEVVDIIREDSINDTHAVKICKLGLGFSGCLDRTKSK